MCFLQIRSLCLRKVKLLRCYQSDALGLFVLCREKSWVEKPGEALHGWKPRFFSAWDNTRGSRSLQHQALGARGSHHSVLGMCANSLSLSWPTSQTEDEARQMHPAQQPWEGLFAPIVAELLKQRRNDSSANHRPFVSLSDQYFPSRLGESDYKVI